MVSKLNLLVSFSILIISAPIFAADDHAQATGSEPGSTSTRAPGDTKIDPKDVDLITNYFEVPSEVVQTRYGTQLPASIEKARPVSVGGQGDESGISKIIAELIGTRSNAQLEKKIMPRVEQEMKKELDKDGTDKNRYLDFLKRVFWAGKIIEGKESDKPEAQAFNKEFRKDFKENQDNIKQLYAKMESAANGNKADKEYVRKTVNHAAIFSFLDSQRKAGNEKDVATIVKALAWDNGGKNELYFKGKDNVVQTLPVGNTTPEIMSALRDFSDRNNGLGGFSLSLQKPGQTDIVLESKGTPSTASTASSTQGGSAPSGSADIGTIRSTIAANCTTCHEHDGATVTGNSVKDFAFVTHGQGEIVERHRRGARQCLPDEGQSSRQREGPVPSLGSAPVDRSEYGQSHEDIDAIEIPQ